jgi:hypothetical protein
MTEYPPAKFTAKGMRTLAADTENAEITGRLTASNRPAYGILYHVRYSAGGEPAEDFIHESTGYLTIG